ncbi:hypothetical protein DLAC_00652 [Tieghemostelium lacteum]|uniref:Leucine-rich repeat-containing protein (LRR) n=1 Tax=Tieghemostelium lacteum TaxID=361077 RepID=A0A152AA98_TIELA|nr:hypothetical protein DLAC_00652 [Tieghemostelium lacteum]|eukprot:KYR03152.1 hypothetical protein DLAC_00652 [Tieghemostelium lacteum]
MTYLTQFQNYYNSFFNVIAENVKTVYMPPGVIRVLLNYLIELDYKVSRGIRGDRNGDISQILKLSLVCKEWCPAVAMLHYRKVRIESPEDLIYIENLKANGIWGGHKFNFQSLEIYIPFLTKEYLDDNDFHKHSTPKQEYLKLLSKVESIGHYENVSVKFNYNHSLCEFIEYYRLSKVALSEPHQLQFYKYIEAILVKMNMKYIDMELDPFQTYHNLVDFNTFCKCNQLVRLNLMNQSLCYINLECVAQQLKSSLVYLKLNNTKLCIQTLGKFLLNQNTVLESLFINFNNIKDMGSKILVGYLYEMTSLTELSCSNNNITDGSLNEWSEYLSSNTSLQSLDISLNQMNASVLVKSLSEHSGIKYLNISQMMESKNHEDLQMGLTKTNLLSLNISGLSFSNFQESIYFSKHLKVLDISYSQVMNLHLLEISIKQLVVVEHVNLIQCLNPSRYEPDEMAPFLNALFLTSPSLKRVNLSLCGLQTLDGKVIANCLKFNKSSCESLILASNILLSAGSRYIFKALKYNTKIKEIDLQGNKIYPKDEKDKWPFIFESNTLTTLNLSGNILNFKSDIDFTKFIEALRKLNNLKSLSILIWHSSSKNFSDLLVETFSKFKSLHYLTLGTRLPKDMDKRLQERLSKYFYCSDY